MQLPLGGQPPRRVQFLLAGRSTLSARSAGKTSKIEQSVSMETATRPQPTARFSSGSIKRFPSIGPHDAC